MVFLSVLRRNCVQPRLLYGRQQESLPNYLHPFPNFKLPKTYFKHKPVKIFVNKKNPPDAPLASGGCQFRGHLTLMQLTQVRAYGVLENLATVAQQPLSGVIAILKRSIVSRPVREEQEIAMQIPTQQIVSYSKIGLVMTTSFGFCATAHAK